MMTHPNLQMYESEIQPHAKLDAPRRRAVDERRRLTERRRAQAARRGIQVRVVRGVERLGEELRPRVRERDDLRQPHVEREIVWSDVRVASQIAGSPREVREVGRFAGGIAA